MNLAQPRVLRYVCLFATYYFFATLCVALVLLLSDVKFGFSLEMIMLISASMGVVSKFVKENDRVPSIQEKRRLSLACMLVSTGWYLLVVFVIVPLLIESRDVSDVYSDQLIFPLLLWLPLLIGGMVVSYIALNIVFGWCACKVHLALRAKANSLPHSQDF
ncbi:ABZJ_00895 family protein [Limnobacter alexandrii]|uniref:ABZJ_00895 family protein n=1 Tax=Limnobacter alexandrii TaxID=2570352 RepID=UPI001BB23612|nr:ABZJ_00895 family protein [Limnobacter alexandrii]